MPLSTTAGRLHKTGENMEYYVIKFRKNNAVHLVKPEGILLAPESFAVVETEHGVDYGQFLKSCVKNDIDEKTVTSKVLRAATDDDKAKIPEISEVELKAYAVCKEKAREKKLEMKLVTVKSVFDRSKIIFYFVAENRIDFRELVRDLAAVFRTRIEMRQIGVRDESRMLGGYGTCGRPLCCMHQSGEFAPVSIRMAKEQNLNLNSLKISGICGRLLCCLSYEFQTYAELNVGLPEAGADISIAGRMFHVLSIDTLRQVIRLNHEGRFIEIKREDITNDNGRFSVSAEVFERIIHQDEQHPEEEED
jgi:cell fate regulator YaaT (PSP1 superfamily)